jgi:hypothetical protein
MVDGPEHTRLRTHVITEQLLLRRDCLTPHR